MANTTLKDLNIKFYADSSNTSDIGNIYGTIPGSEEVTKKPVDGRSLEDLLQIAIIKTDKRKQDRDMIIFGLNLVQKIVTYTNSYIEKHGYLFRGNDEKNYGYPITREDTFDFFHHYTIEKIADKFTLFDVKEMIDEGKKSLKNSLKRLDETEEMYTFLSGLQKHQQTDEKPIYCPRCGDVLIEKPAICNPQKHHIHDTEPDARLRTYESLHVSQLEKAINDSTERKKELIALVDERESRIKILETTQEKQHDLINDQTQQIKANEIQNKEKDERILDLKTTIDNFRTQTQSLEATIEVLKQVIINMNQQPYVTWYGSRTSACDDANNINTTLNSTSYVDYADVGGTTTTTSSDMYGKTHSKSEVKRTISYDKAYFDYAILIDTNEHIFTPKDKKLPKVYFRRDQFDLKETQKAFILEEK